MTHILLSPIAVNLWLTLGAALQTLLILRARCLPSDKWWGPLIAATFLPVLMIAYVEKISGPAVSPGTAFIGPLLGALTAGWALMMFAPPRISAATVLSLSVTFWAAYWPGRGPLPLWAIVAVPLSLLALAYALAPWPPPRVLRLVMFVWYLIAAGALAATGFSEKTLGAGLEAWPVLAEPLTLALTGAQFLLFMHALAGLLMLIPFVGEEKGWRESVASVRKNAESFMSSYDAAYKPGWVGLTLIAAQAVVLGAMVRSGATVQTETIRLAALAAMAHGAMSGGGELEREKPQRRCAGT